MSVPIELSSEVKAGWLALAAAESREFRADLAGRPRLHGVDLPSTKAVSIRMETSPWSFPISHSPNERPLWMEGAEYCREFRMVSNPRVVVLHKH